MKRRMKRKMKRNKLLKKVLTLGLAAAVAVSSMAPTLAMMEPVVVKAAPEEESKEFIAYDLCELYPELKSEAEGTIHLNYVDSDEYVVTHPLLNGWESKDDTFREIEEKMLADGFQGWTLKVTVEVADDSAADNATGDLQGLLFAMESSVQGKDNWKGTNGEEGREQPIEIVKGDSNNLVFDLSSLSGYKELAQLGLRFDAKNGEDDINKKVTYTITSAKIVTDKCKVTRVKKAVINDELQEKVSNQAWTKNIAEVEEVGSVVSGDGTNTITVKAKLGDMIKTPDNGGGDVGHRAFPIVVELDSKATECYKFKENGSWEESEDGNANARITDAWKCLNESVEPGDWNTTDVRKGKNCIVWLNETWVGEGKTISFDETNEYTIKVVDTTEYNIMPTVENANVSIQKAEETATSASVTNATVGETYAITLTAEDGYYFGDAAVSALSEWTVTEEKIKYSKDYTVEVDYSQLNTDKKINPIPDDVTATECPRETLASAEVTISYESGTLTFDSAGTYTINGTEHILTDSEKTVSINEDFIGTIQIVKKASDRLHKDSNPVPIVIKRAPVPEGLAPIKAEDADSNGKINGTTITMQYKLKDGGSWTECNNTETEVDPGTYLVRYKANDGSGTEGFEGESTEIIVGIEGQTVINLVADANNATSKVKTYGDAGVAFSITIKNIGDNPDEVTSAAVTLTAEEGGDWFENLESSKLEVPNTSGNGTITVTPKNSLNAGTYKATLKVSYVADDSPRSEVEVKLTYTVNKAAALTYTSGYPSASSIVAGKIEITKDDIVLSVPDAAATSTYKYGYATENTAPTTEDDSPVFSSVAEGEYFVFVKVVNPNYEDSAWCVSNETVTVAAPTSPSNPTNPGTGSGSGGSGGSSGGSSSSGGGSGSSGGTGTTPVVPAVTTTADGTTVSLNKDGAYVDKNGKPAANAVIKEPTGVMHVTDATGHVVKDSIATAADGKTYVVDADGKVVVSNIAQINGKKYIAGASGQLVKGQFSNISGNTYYSDTNGVVKTNELFTADFKQYVADENGVIVKDKMTTLADGKKVYSGEDGVVVTNKVITVDGKKYYATKTGVIATKKIVTAGGKKYYATKTGAIATKKVVKAGGKKYYATKTGALATNKWVKVGNKKYYCNKKGVITKTKKVKK